MKPLLTFLKRINGLMKSDTPILTFLMGGGSNTNEKRSKTKWAGRGGSIADFNQKLLPPPVKRKIPASGKTKHTLGYKTFIGWEG